MRKSCSLSGRPSRPLPELMVTMSAQIARGFNRHGGPIVPDSLLGWSIASYRVNGSDVTAGRRYEGTSVRDALLALRHIGQGRTVMPVLSHNAADVACNSGLFKAIEDGRASFNPYPLNGKRQYYDKYHPAKTLLPIISDKVQHFPFYVPGELLKVDMLSLSCYGLPAIDYGLDCKIQDSQLEQWLRDFAFVHQRLDGSSMGFTSSQWAMDVLRRSKSISSLRCNIHHLAVKMEAMACSGGMVYVPYTGPYNQTCHYMDFRSFYGSLLLRYPMPVDLVDVYADQSVLNLAKCLQSYSVIAVVVLSDKAEEHPLLAPSIEKDNSGRCVACLASPMLVYALEQSLIRGVILASVYNQSMICQDKLGQMMELRDCLSSKSHKHAVALLKRGMAQVSGTLAKRDYEDVDHPLPRHHYRWDRCKFALQDGRMADFMSLDGNATLRCRGGFSRETLPAIFAHITAFGRLLLQQAIDDSGKGNCLYADTDGGFFNHNGLYRLAKAGYLNSNHMVHMTIKETATWVEIAGPRNYWTPNRKVHAGIHDDMAIAWSRNGDGYVGNSVIHQLNQHKCPSPQSRLLANRNRFAR